MRRDGEEFPVFRAFRLRAIHRRAVNLQFVQVVAALARAVQHQHQRETRVRLRRFVRRLEDVIFQRFRLRIVEFVRDAATAANDRRKLDRRGDESPRFRRFVGGDRFDLRRFAARALRKEPIVKRRVVVSFVPRIVPDAGVNGQFDVRVPGFFVRVDHRLRHAERNDVILIAVERPNRRRRHFRRRVRVAAAANRGRRRDLFRAFRKERPSPETAHRQAGDVNAVFVDRILFANLVDQDTKLRRRPPRIRETLRRDGEKLPIFRAFRVRENRRRAVNLQAVQVVAAFADPVQEDKERKARVRFRRLVDRLERQVTQRLRLRFVERFRPEESAFALRKGNFDRALNQLARLGSLVERRFLNRFDLRRFAADSLREEPSIEVGFRVSVDPAVVSDAGING